MIEYRYTIILFSLIDGHLGFLVLPTVSNFEVKLFLYIFDQKVEE